MPRQIVDGYPALTEKEKQTLRLILRGHDAKSIARELDLSVHTINERLREARRKLAVSSSREAARLLLERESESPNSAGDKQLGEACPAASVPPMAAPENGGGWIGRLASIIMGVTLMAFMLGLMLLAAQPDTAYAPASGQPANATNLAVQTAARNWLTLVDQERWEESWQATGAQFRKLNTSEVWAEVSRKARAPLGAVIARTFTSQQTLPAPPSGYEVVKFRTRFANKADAIETVTLEREDGGWRVVGVTIG